MLLEGAGKCEALIRFKFRSGSKGGKMRKRGESGGVDYSLSMTGKK